MKVELSGRKLLKGVKAVDVFTKAEAMSETVGA